jgi:hypothetical protein
MNLERTVCEGRGRLAQSNALRWLETLSFTVRQPPGSCIRTPIPLYVNGIVRPQRPLDNDGV